MLALVESPEDLVAQILLRHLSSEVMHSDLNRA
jgi:hypothetical protein